MTPEQQVTNLELSKKMKELGFPQKSMFYWDKDKKYLINSYNWADVDREDWEIIKEKYCSAYTVAELGEMLPRKVLTSQLTFTKGGGTKKWIVAYLGIWIVANDTLADGMAKMLIYLKENYLI